MPGQDFELVIETPNGLRAPRETTLAVRGNLLSLMDRPGLEGRIAAYPSKSAAIRLADELRRDKPSRRRPPGHWEFRISKLPDGRTGVYAKYLGSEVTDNAQATTGRGDTSQ